MNPAPPRIPGELVSLDLGLDDMLDEPSFTDVSISGARLTGTTAHNLAFTQTRLAKVDLSGSRLPRFEVSDAIFADCNLANVRTSDGFFRRVVFTQNKMTGFHLDTGTVANVTVSDSLLDFARFHTVKLKDVRFERCQLREADFSNCTFEGVVFAGCDMDRIAFDRLKISQSRISRCSLIGARGITSLRGISMERADLLDHADLFAAELGIVIE